MQSNTATKPERPVLKKSYDLEESVAELPRLSQPAENFGGKRAVALVGDYLCFEHLVLKGDALGIVFREPGCCSIGVCEDLEVIRVSDLLARIYVAEHGHCWTLADGAMRSGPSLRDGYALGLLTSEGLGLSPGSLE